MEHLELDYLIIGQGIAGSMLSHFLIKKGKSVICVDNAALYSSSLVAAGLFNPITGRRIVKTWMADDLLPFAKQTYTELEALLRQRFYHPKNNIKIFTSIKEQNDWLAKSSAPEFEQYLAASEGTLFQNTNIPSPFGSFEITQSGYVDLPLFLLNYKKYLEANGLLMQASFDYNDLTIHENGIQWQNIKAKKIIFCEGHQAIQNPFFKDFPFVLTKGELLTIACSELALEKLISKGIFILPLGEDTYRIGSTYSWSDLSPEPTEAGRQALIEKLEKTITCPYTILSHQAGIRPTVKDRRPFIGLHPKHPSIGLFNGMGTKGASIAPWFAHHFAKALEENETLNPLVSIQRFF
jgi:glycine/D-amino acid oxidase-like deaminating enzyme